MGRELKRVALDFEWPVGKIWTGYEMNIPCLSTNCAACGGTGMSGEARLLWAHWWGHDAIDGRPIEPFKAADPHHPGHPMIVRYALANVEGSPTRFYGTGENAVKREARRLADLWNSEWMHHLTQDDVDALIAADRLMKFTHTWSRGDGWKPKIPAPTVTARQVNDWGMGNALGLTSSEAWVCIKARCERRSVSHQCDRCGGEGEIWPSPEAKASYEAAVEAWKPTEPPAGEGWQMWETVSDGSPISPVFEKPEDLALYLTVYPSGTDAGTSYQTWMKFILGDGWAPSAMTIDGQMMTGVQGVVVEQQEPGR